MPSGAPDYTGMKVDVVSRPEWAAVVDMDKTIDGGTYGIAVGGIYDLEYLVPAGKTLYVASVAFLAGATNAADRDLNQMAYMSLQEGVGNTSRYSQGGNGGGASAFLRVAKFTAGQIARLRLVNMTNHVMSLYGTMLGYEV